MDQEAYDRLVKKIKGNRKLMKKSLKMIISFFTTFFIGLVLLMVLQENKFFIFNFKRTFNNAPNPFIAEIFSLVFLIIVVVGLIAYVSLAYNFAHRKILTEQEQLVSYPKYRKLFNLADVFSVVPIFLVIVMVINGFFFSFAQVEGISMQPTYCDNDAVIIKYVNDYEDNNIVILQHYDTQTQENIYMIKRLVGLPGDHLVVNDTGVYINSEKIEGSVGSQYISYNIIIPEGFYYVLGDHRDCSKDSRRIGLISYDNMLGKVIYRFSFSECEVESCGIG